MVIYNLDVGSGGSSGPVTPDQIELEEGKILVGQVTDVAGAVTPSGGFTMTVAGVATLSNAEVIAKVLTAYASGAGTVSATDTILQAIQKLNGNAVAIKSTADAALPSASFTDAAVTSKLITGYSSGAGTISASDTVLQAINKLNGNIVANAPANDTIVSASLGSDFDVTTSYSDTPGGGSTIVTGLSCSITTVRTNQVVKVEFIGSVSLATSNGIMMYLSVDSGTPVPVCYMNTGAGAANQMNAAFSISIPITGAAGAHTVDLYAARESGVLARVRGANNAIGTRLTVAVPA